MSDRRGSTAHFGRYELIGTLGQGGFATVYRARDPMLGRDVAIKALLPHLAANPEVRRRFSAEAQALARLHHPNIVTVHDVGEADGRPFFAMELIEGQTLETLLANGRGLSADRVADILASLAAAVDVLHDAGLVHRDIKPANAMVERDGRVVLMDLGIARALGQTQHTATGTSLGTPEYMAPEQVRGQPVGPAADIYALGVLAYQLYAGRPPFAGDTGYVMHAHAYETPPPLRGLRPGLPEGVYRAVAAALAKDPRQRPTSGSAFAALLHGAATPWPTPDPTPLLGETEVITRGGGGGRGAGGAPLVIGGVVLAGLVVVCATVAFAVLARPHPAPPSSSAGAASASTTTATPQNRQTQTPPLPPPAMPGNVQAAALDPTSLRVTWQAGSGNEDGFDLIRDQDSSSSQHVGTGVTSYEWHGLPQGARTCIAIRATRGGSSSAYTGWNCATLPSASASDSSSQPANNPPPPPPPQPPQPQPSNPTLSIAGNWQFTDYLRFGQGAGSQYTFHVTFSQQGSHVDGSGDGLTINGQMNGNVLRASFRQGNDQGSFAWTFTGDSTRFEGAFSVSSLGNGGTSYGRRSAGSVSSAPQTTVYVFGPGTNGDRVLLSSTYYVCYTVFPAGQVRVVDASSGAALFDRHDDGTGDCTDPIPATAPGTRTYQSSMFAGENRIATGSVTITIAP